MNFFFPLATYFIVIAQTYLPATPPQIDAAASDLFTELHLESLSLSYIDSPVNTSLIAIPKASSSQSIQFTPPTGWRFADAATLPSSVKSLVVGTGEH